ncbi:MAG: hypothetical protein QF823_01730 [Candidatus Marinimicrobia bacterium]|nr:hypothetical protein [Candidatus Neomarinimicrobiota bacterium]
MKYSIILIVLFSVLNGQRPGDIEVRQGVDAFYNYEHAKSIKILTQAREDYPEHPGVHVAWAAAHWRHNEANLTIEEVYTNFENHLAEIVTVYDSLVAKYPNDPEYQLYQGTAKGLKARIFLGQKKWIPTLVSAYQGFRIVQVAHRIDTTITDAYLPIGIVEYYAGMSNLLVKAGAEMFGLNPSKGEGIRKMEITATRSQWAWTESMSILSFIYQFIDVDQERALKYSEKLSKKYPRNFDFQVHYAFSLIQTSDLKRVKKQLDQLNQRLDRLGPRHQKLYTAYLEYLWGHYYFLKGEEDKAMGFLDKCIELYNAELDAFLANAYLLQGMILDKKKDRMGAVIAYKKCIKLDNHIHAISLARQYLDEPFQG